MNQKFEQLKPYLENWAALQAAFQLFGWDMETLAPEGAGKRTSLVFGVLSDRLREETLKPETKAIVRELLKDETLSDAERSIAKKIQKDIDDLELIPADEYRAFTELRPRLPPSGRRRVKRRTSTSSPRFWKRFFAIPESSPVIRQKRGRLSTMCSWKTSKRASPWRCSIRSSIS